MGRTTVGGYLPVLQGVNFNAPCLFREGVVMMVTYSELFPFGTFVISLVSLILQTDKEEVTAPKVPQL